MCLPDLSCDSDPAEPGLACSRVQLPPCLCSGASRFGSFLFSAIVRGSSVPSTHGDVFANRRILIISVLGKPPRKGCVADELGAGLRYLNRAGSISWISTFALCLSNRQSM